MRFLSLLILFCLASCTYLKEPDVTFVAFGGKGAYRKGVGVVYQNEKSFRDGALAAAAVSAGYFANAASQAAEVTAQATSADAAKTAQQQATEAAAVEITKSNNAVKIAELELAAP